MISLLDLVGAIAAFLALILVFTSWRQRLNLEEKCIVAIVCSVTVLINTEGYFSWIGRGLYNAPNESWGDYIQVLQPALWGMFFYVVVQSAQRKELVKSRQQMRSIVENMPVILHAYDENGCLLAWNRYAEDITGYRREEVVGNPNAMHQFFPNTEYCEQLLGECKAGGASYSHRVYPLVTKQEGKRQIAWYNISENFPIPDWANWGIGLDITEQMAAQRELEHKATHDELTGLANRALLRDRLVHALIASERHNYTGALLLLDLDHFKMVNDSHGHPVGDKLLCEVGVRLRGCIKATDTLARFGGDEFVILLDNVRNPEGAAMVAERIASSITSVPFYLCGNEIRISTSIGISIFPDDDVRIDELIKNVDLALFAAKANGRNSYHFYSRVMHDNLRWQHQVSERVRNALEQKAFELHYQAQRSLSDNKLIGMEALLRWQDADQAPLSPGVFIPIAENMGLMPVLGKWIVEAAIKQAALWQKIPGVPIAINLSAIQFHQPYLVESVLEVVEAFGVSPELIEFEITESAVMRNLDTSIATMRRLAENGFGISLDDFGTGYSSLSYLKRFPVSKIKIDQSFVKGLETDPADAAIVRSVIDLGHCLNMKVLAEGVETLAQLQHLGDAGCDYIQGYYCSKPLSVVHFNDYINTAASA